MTAQLKTKITFAGLGLLAGWLLVTIPIFPIAPQIFNRIGEFWHMRAHGDTPVIVYGGSVHASATSARWRRTTTGKEYVTVTANNGNEYVDFWGFPSGQTPPDIAGSTSGWVVKIINKDTTTGEKDAFLLCSNRPCNVTDPRNPAGNVFIRTVGNSDRFEELGSSSATSGDPKLLTFHDDICDPDDTVDNSPCDHIVKIKVFTAANPNGIAYRCPDSLCTVTVGATP